MRTVTEKKMVRLSIKGIGLGALLLMMILPLSVLKGQALKEEGDAAGA